MRIKIIRIHYILIFAFIVAILFNGLDWGLPSSDRTKHLFESKDIHKAFIPKLTRTYTGEKTKTKNKIYVENYLEYTKNQSYETAINLGLARYLVVPYAGDDAFILKAIKNLDPKKLDFDPNYYIYGGGLVYSSAVTLKIAELFNIIELKSGISYYLENPNEIGKIYYLLRILVASFAVVGLIFLFYFIEKFHGLKFAYLTLIIILFNPETLISSRVIEPHIFVLPFFLGAVYFAIKLLEKQKNNYSLIFYGLFSGLSIGTQATSFYIIFPIFLIQYIYFNKGCEFKKICKNFIIFFSYLSLSFFILNPYSIINFNGFITDIFTGVNNVASIKSNNVNFYENFYAPYQISLFYVILFFASIFYNIFYIKNEKSRIYLSLVIPSICVYFSLSGIMQYIYPSLSIFALLSGFMIFDLLKKIKKYQKIAFISLLIIFFVTSPFKRSLYYLINFKNDNKLEAARWINENIDKESIIGLSFPPTNWNMVPFQFYNYKLIDYKADAKKDFIILLNGGMINRTDEYKKIKSFYPKSILGYHPPLKGEVEAILAKKIDIYKRR